MNIDDKNIINKLKIRKLFLEYSFDFSILKNQINEFIIDLNKDEVPLIENEIFILSLIYKYDEYVFNNFENYKDELKNYLKYTNDRELIDIVFGPYLNINYDLINYDFYINLNEESDFKISKNLQKELFEGLLSFYNLELEKFILYLKSNNSLKNINEYKLFQFLNIYFFEEEIYFLEIENIDNIFKILYILGYDLSYDKENNLIYLML